ATIANMAPEYGATIGFFPVDQETLAYLKLSGRTSEQIALVEAYTKEQGLFRTGQTPDPIFSDTLELDLSQVEPSLAGPKRPQDRVLLREAKQEFRKALADMLHGKSNDLDPERIADWVKEGGSAVAPDPAIMHHLGKIGARAAVEINGNKFDVKHGSVVIAAITSCTNTSNPAVMIGAGLLAKKAVEKGLSVKPWVKTSLAPGSKVVMDYLAKTGVLPYLEKLAFYLVGFGCTTCIGNSGPLEEPIAQAVKQEDLVVAAVLSGNRNFEGRVHSLVRANYLASPPLVVAYALAGTVDINLEKHALGHSAAGEEVYLKDIWPSDAEIREAMKTVDSEMFRKQYQNVFQGDAIWQRLDVPQGSTFAWDPSSTYVKNPPYFVNMPDQPAPLKNISGARVLALLGDSVTTDHISPAGNIPEDSPAGKYLIAHGVTKKDFNSYGARRGNHEVMVRGTFANIRLRNLLAGGTEGGFTRHLPDGKVTTIFEASELYAREGVPLIVIAGKEYGSGSSRDWAAKGPALLGVRAVMAQSYERIHRSNLIGMGILPLQFLGGQTPVSLGLTGEEAYEIRGIDGGLRPGQILDVQSKGLSGIIDFKVITRIQTPEEVNYYRHGGILQYVLRQLG
ncbi:MAG: aconitate hydratase AcnA, partial [Candidatus Omnitrophica bacterium]|nr:aconitate hydratase AcnA [Candidatus Omnitrophota bacterium]